MSEAEFERLLDRVRTAIAPVRGEETMFAQPPLFRRSQKAANDNESAWPIIPFPEGWYAAC